MRVDMAGSSLILGISSISTIKEIKTNIKKINATSKISFL